MFKASSKNRQDRSVRSVIESRDNSGGMDPTAFEQEQQRDRLTIRKREVEMAASRLRETIHAAQRKFHTTGNRTEPALMNKWLRDRQNAKEELADIDKQLSRLKMQKRVRCESDQTSFPRQFMWTAKELLAGPVYDRILTATIHKVGSMYDAGEMEKNK